MHTLLLFVVGLVAAANGQQCAYSSVCADNTMCKYTGFGILCTNVKYYGVTSAADKQAVVDAHNNLRRRVALGQETLGTSGPQPKAANMEQLIWDDELASVAERWAEQCNFGHDTCRSVSRFYVGQNVYKTFSKGGTQDGTQSWKAAVQAWYDEVKDFSKDSIKPFQFTSATGHYTQAVWAKTKTVGCGFVAYTDSDGWYDKYYVCNYGPGGNYLGDTMYEVGEPCSKCSGACNNGLCV